jgi:hypothetical protein
VISISPESDADKEVFCDAVPLPDLTHATAWSSNHPIPEDFLSPDRFPLVWYFLLRFDIF